MKMLLTLFVFCISSFSIAQVDSLPVPGFAVARDVPNAVLMPNPDVVHQVLFDAVTGEENVDDIDPMLLAVARYVNTLAKYGVPAENRDIAVIIHQGATPIILQNDEFKARNDGVDNPNIELIRSLKAVGVKLHVCGQAVVGNSIDPATILPEIQLDLWALTTIIDYEQRGFIRIGG